MKDFAKLTTIRSYKRPGTKTVFVERDRREEVVSEQEYINIVNAAPFFRRLGGSETLSRGYTKKGYLVTRILSRSPDREQQTERLFDFDV